MDLESTATMDEGSSSVDEVKSLNALSTVDFDNAVKGLKEAINSQYFKVSAKSTSIIHNGEVLLSELSDQDIEVFDRTNYDVKALQGENIVLFRKPLFISKLNCGINIHGDLKSKTVRLLSGKQSEKKFVSHFHRGNRTDCYEVNDIIYGMILPPRVNYLSSDAVDFYQFYRDDEVLSNITEAHVNLSLEVSGLQQKVSNNTSDITKALEVKLKSYKVLKSDIETTLKEKNRLENSTNDFEVILVRIKDDIVKETTELENIHTKKSYIISDIEKAKKELDEYKSGIVINDKEINSLAEKLASRREELVGLEAKINDSKRDINITTLDMKGFSRENQKQLQCYFWLGLVSISFLAAIFCLIYINASTFAELVDTTTPEVKPWNILLSRLPLITGTALIIGTLSALLFYLVNHITSVNEDKMSMLKASILAEQITGSLPTQDMSEIEIRDFKRDTKIELVMKVFTPKEQKSKNNLSPELIKILLDGTANKK